jgi:hypothetical protein
LGDRTFDDAFDGLTNDPEFAISSAGCRVAVRFVEEGPGATAPGRTVAHADDGR